MHIHAVKFLWYNNTKISRDIHTINECLLGGAGALVVCIAAAVCGVAKASKRT